MPRAPGDAAFADPPGGRRGPGRGPWPDPTAQCSLLSVFTRGSGLGRKEAFCELPDLLKLVPVLSPLGTLTIRLPGKV